MRIYLDSAPVIYVVERHARYAEYLDTRLSIPGDTLVASDLTRLECRVLPVREGNHRVLQDFDDYFETRVSEMIRLTREVIDMATLIRARYGFATPDAIHLSAALVSGCDVFLTNDNRLARFDAMSVEVIEDYLTV